MTDPAGSDREATHRLWQVNHLALPVADLARASQFYQGVFGLPELTRPQLSVAGVWLGLGTVALHLTLNVAPEAGVSIGHFAITVARHEVRSLVAKVAAHGGTVVRDVVVREELGRPVTSALCRDPDGNLFEFTDAGEAHGD